MLFYIRSQKKPEKEGSGFTNAYRKWKPWDKLGGQREEEHAGIKKAACVKTGRQRKVWHVHGTSFPTAEKS